VAGNHFVQKCVTRGKLWSQKKIVIMRSKILIASILITSLCIRVNSQFNQVTVPFINVYLGASDWADFNKDGYPDVVIAGMDSLNTRRTLIYKNNGDSTFTALSANLPGVDRADAEWGDFNNDGFADLLILGDTDSGTPITRLFSNNGNETFTEIPYVFTGVKHGEAAWADYNRDGLQDIVVTGDDDNTYTTILYKNNGDSTFTAYPAFFPGLLHSTVDWDDFNRDGFPDLLICGHSSTSSSPSTYVFSNRGDGTFSPVYAGILGVAYGTARWGDFNTDGLPDIFISGSFNGLVASIYRNNGDSTFTQVSIPQLEGLFHCDASVFDYNNDGLTDILLAGHHGPKVFLYKNTGDFSFEKETITITSTGYSSIAVGDFNTDGKTDVLVSGEISAGGARRTRLYANDFGEANTPPSLPVNLSYSLTCGKIILAWTKGNDNETPGASLSSSVYIGTAMGRTDIAAPGSLLMNGYRLTEEPGNAGTDTFMIICGLDPGTYYWGVQTVDLVNTGSAFSEEMTFTVPVIPEADAGPDHTVCAGQPYNIDESELSYTPTGNYTWTSTGSGTFDNAGLPAPVYTPSEDDLLAGSVTLWFHVSDSYHCPEGTADDKTITFAGSSIRISEGSPERMNVCEGTDTVIWITAEGTDLAFQWISSATGGNWTQIEGATTPEFSLNGITKADEKYYSCIVTDINSCIDSGAVTTQLLVYGFPAKPVITETNDTLVSLTSFDYYQWEDNLGNQLSDARYLVPVSAGSYWLFASDNSFCWSVSDPYAWEPTGIEELNTGTYVIYPNPASERLAIKCQRDAGNQVTVNMYGINGVFKGSWKLVSAETVLNVADLARGLYLLEIVDNDKIVGRNTLLLK
jgi:hypothetical protein